MAMITRYIDPDAAAGGDGTTTSLSGANCAYVSLSVWEAARQGDLVTEGNIEQAVCQSTHANHTADSAALTIDGSTTNSSCYMEITCASGSRHVGVWDTSKYRWERANGYITISDPYVRIDGLQIRDSGFAQSYYTVYLNENHIRISNCIIRNVASGGNYANVCIATTAGTSGAQRYYYIWNNIIYDGYAGINSQQDYVTAYLYFNTVHGMTGTGILDASRTGDICYAKNNLVYNCADNWSNAGTWGTGSTNNLSGPGSDTAIPSTNAQNGVTVTFAGTGDYRLASNDAGAIGYGADLSDDQYLPVTTDICGNTRSTTAPCIGAFEYVVAASAAASIIPAIMAHLNRMRAN